MIFPSPVRREMISDRSSPGRATVDDNVVRVTAKLQSTVALDMYAFEQQIHDLWVIVPV